MVVFTRGDQELGSDGSTYPDDTGNGTFNEDKLMTGPSVVRKVVLVILVLWVGYDVLQVIQTESIGGVIGVARIIGGSIGYICVDVVVWVLVFLFVGMGLVIKANAKTETTEQPADDALDVMSQVQTQTSNQTTIHVKPIDPSIKRSGGWLISIAVVLAAMNAGIYIIQTKDYGYAIGSCTLPVVLWVIFMTRHYWSKTPKSTDGWSWTLVLLTFMSGSQAAKQLKVRSPHELMEATKRKSTEPMSPVEQKVVNVMKQVQEINAEENKAEADFYKSYGGKNFMENECYLNAQVAQVCADDTQKLVDQMYQTNIKRDALVKSAGTTVGKEQDAQSQASQRFFTAVVEWYRYAADPSNEIRFEKREVYAGAGKGKRFDELRSAALSAQTDFQKATKAYAAYQNVGLKTMGLSPKDFGAEEFQEPKQAVTTYQEKQATRVRRAKDCEEDRLELQYIKEQKDVVLNVPGSPEGAVQEPLSNGKVVAGIGGNAQHPLWYFDDGSSMPLDEFVARTQKDIALTCDK